MTQVEAAILLAKSSLSKWAVYGKLMIIADIWRLGDSAKAREEIDKVLAGVIEDFRMDRTE